MEQMTIFDLLPADPIPERWQDLPPEKVAEAIAKRFGQVPKPYFDGFRFEVGPLECTIDFQHYRTLDERNGRPFIGIGCDNRKAHAGAGAPCDDIAEAVEYLRKIIRNLSGLDASSLTEE